MSIQLTADGSHTIISDKYNVAYHSIHGALQETRHVFIEAGLNHRAKELSSIKILEVGFGTGLNLLATWSECKREDYDVEFHSIEPYPIYLDIAEKLNYHEHIPNIDGSEIRHIHETPWEQLIELAPNLSLHKHPTTLEAFESSVSFDVIYFDAFAPTAQPELWQPNMLKKLHGLLNNHGVLVTYCAKGQFKRDLKSVGFEVQSIPGPPRKREMTRAVKKV